MSKIEDSLSEIKKETSNYKSDDNEADPTYEVHAALETNTISESKNRSVEE